MLYVRVYLLDLAFLKHTHLMYGKVYIMTKLLF